MEFKYPEIETIRKKLEEVAGEEDKPVDPEFGGPLPGKEENSLISSISSVISWVLTPLFMPVFGIIFIMYLSILDYTDPRTKLLTIAAMFCINALLPMLLIFFLKLIGLVQDVALNSRRERLLPYLISITAFALSALFLKSRHAPDWVWYMYIGGAVAATINLIVNTRWKISAHAAGAAGVIAMLFVINTVGVPSHNMLWWIVGSMSLSGLLGSARIYLGRHTLMQVLAGYIVGFCPVFFMGIYL